MAAYGWWSAAMGPGDSLPFVEAVADGSTPGKTWPTSAAADTSSVTFISLDTLVVLFAFDRDVCKGCKPPNESSSCLPPPPDRSRAGYAIITSKEVRQVLTLPQRDQGACQGLAKGLPRVCQGACQGAGRGAAARTRRGATPSRLESPLPHRPNQRRRKSKTSREVDNFPMLIGFTNFTPPRRGTATRPTGAEGGKETKGMPLQKVAQPNLVTLPRGCRLT